ncbi:MAG: hypothetical protein SGI72_11555 [Planctomycetota bacterium]|nr:hypothetical protein [Planctomycetota bacterium]
MSHSAICTVHDASCANTVVDDLRAFGFPREDISVVLQDRLGARELAGGWAGGIGLLAVSGVGACLATGPLHGILLANKLAASQGIDHSLNILGLPHFEAKQLENHLRAGHAWIAVLVEGAVETTRAIEIFERHRADSIGVAEASSREAAS